MSPIRLGKEPDKLLHMTDIATLDSKLDNIDFPLVFHHVLYQKHIIYVADKCEVQKGLVKAIISSAILRIKTVIWTIDAWL